MGRGATEVLRVVEDDSPPPQRPTSSRLLRGTFGVADRFMAHVRDFERLIPEQTHSSAMTGPRQVHDR
jgi:hypothetical protein